MRAEDAARVAQIHFQEITGFLPSLGADFLRKFYLNSLKVPGFIAFVAIDEGRVFAFITACRVSKNFSRLAVSQDPSGFFFSLITVLLKNPLKIINLVRLLSYRGFARKGAELISLAVDKKYRRRGTGRSLFKRLVKELRQSNINSFHISVYDGMKANSFYRKMNCRLSDSFNFLGKKMNDYRYGLAAGRKLRVVLLNYDSLYANPVFLPLLDMEKIEIVAVFDSGCILYGKSNAKSLLFLWKRQGYKYFLFKACDQIAYSLTGLWPARGVRFMREIKKRDIPIIKVRDVNSAESVAMLCRLKPDLLISYFNQILKKEVLSVPKIASINIHPGYLPEFRGVASSFWAMKNKSAYGGVTLHHMKLKLDEGDIISKAKVPISNESLHRHNYLCCRMGGLLMRELLGKIESGRSIPGQIQKGGSYYSWPRPRDIDGFLKQGFSLFKLRDLKLYFQ